MIRRAARPGLRRKKGAIVALYTAPPDGSVVICLDELGPESVRSFPGRRLVRSEAGAPRGRATQEIDSDRRGSGSVFGAFVPATGAVLTRSYPRRTTAQWLECLDAVEAWRDPAVERVSAVLDNLRAHRALDVLLWALAHPHREFVFQPKYAAYRNLIEPWWKVLRSLALAGHHFETWAEIDAAVAAATRYWNAHRHPFRWAPRKPASRLPSPAFRPRPRHPHPST